MEMQGELWVELDEEEEERWRREKNTNKSIESTQIQPGTGRGEGGAVSDVGPIWWTLYTRGFFRSTVVS